LITAESSLRAVAFEVSTHLSVHRHVAVLSGGSAATVYAPEAYQSSDLDFVMEFFGSRAEMDELVRPLGYERKGRVYEHTSNVLTLDFPSGPLAVGDERILSWTTLREGEMLLHVITPTDCVRDRLASFIHWNDRAGLDQALAVAKAQEVNIPLIEGWCRREGGEAKLREFSRRLGL
jgi:hypothetical protein